VIAFMARKPWLRLLGKSRGVIASAPSPLAAPEVFCIVSDNVAAIRRKRQFKNHVVVRVG